VTTADRLRHRAREIEGEAHNVRWTEPATARHLTAIARELTELADNLPPERTET